MQLLQVLLLMLKDLLELLIFLLVLSLQHQETLVASLLLQVDL